MTLRTLCTAFLLLVFAGPATAQKVSAGTIVDLGVVQSSYTDPRRVARYQKRIDALVERRGYRQGRNWASRDFPGQAHNEISWASRVEIPLQFLLPPVESSSGR